MLGKKGIAWAVVLLVLVGGGLWLRPWADDNGEAKRGRGARLAGVEPEPTQPELRGSVAEDDTSAGQGLARARRHDPGGSGPRPARVGRAGRRIASGRRVRGGALLPLADPWRTDELRPDADRREGPVVGLRASMGRSACLLRAAIWCICAFGRAGSRPRSGPICRRANASASYSPKPFASS